MRNLYHCNLSSTLHTYDNLEKLPYFKFTARLEEIFNRHETLDKVAHLISVQDARLVFRERRASVVESAVWNGSDKDYSVLKASHTTHRGWCEPSVKERSMICLGPSFNLVYVFRSWFTGVHGHFLHDNLPVIAWLRQIMPPQATLLLVKDALSERIMDLADHEFATQRIAWVAYNALTCAAEARLLAPPSPQWREHGLLRLLRSWIRPPGIASLAPNSHTEAVTIYYSRRKSQSVQHGRYMLKAHEEAILSLIHSKMKVALKGVHSRLVVYDGHLRNGSSIPIARQAELFQSASFVIGPHGAGLANIVWLPNLRPYLHHSTLPAGTRSSDAEQNCQDRPRVLEMICGTRSDSVQNGCPYWKTFHYIFPFAFWVEYHHVLFAANSSEKATWVQLDELALALDSLFL